jgi:hypothetical protein
MPIIARGTETYLLITGVQTDTTVQLGPHTELLPATCHLNYDEFAGMMKDSYLDFAVGLLVIPLVRSQLHVTADDAKQLAQRAWNAQWDCLLLSALFDQTVLWNVQSDVPAEMIGPGTAINISNYHLSGFHIKGEYELTTSDKEWLEKQALPEMCPLYRKSVACTESLRRVLTRATIYESLEFTYR